MVAAAISSSAISFAVTLTISAVSEVQGVGKDAMGDRGSRHEVAAYGMAGASERELPVVS